jgi:hypothetical protein
MKIIRTILTTTSLASALLLSGTALARDNAQYEITVTNITQGEIFTPIMVASHTRGVKLFELGKPASTELEILAEGGNPGPLADSLISSGAALDVATADGVLLPGSSLTLHVKTDRHHSHVSVAAMLVPSNDAFFAVNGIAGPLGKKTKTLFSPAYDAGGENNDESCAHVPGPPFVCSGEGYNAASGEGYVYIHPGIQGIGDINAASYDWNNPVARITIRRVKD